MASESASFRQLTLEVGLRDEATLENYLVAAELEPLIAILGQLGEQTGGATFHAVYMFGSPGAGKTHLLQAACHLMGGAALYLPLAQMQGCSPEELLDGVESLDLVCLDDIDSVLGDESWEVALFNLYNRAQAASCSLLITGDAAPRALTLGLEDLRSRLSWGGVYRLPRADDDVKAAILQFRAARRGLNMSAEVAAYIVSRSPRAMEQLLAQLDVLDRASLAQQRRLSIPFVKQALDL